jgi:hypothetical protein
MTIDPRIVATILNVVALLGVLGLTAWLGLTILRGRSRWPKLLLPILALIFTFAAMALVTFNRHLPAAGRRPDRRGRRGRRTSLGHPAASSRRRRHPGRQRGLGWAVRGPGRD